MTAKPRVSFVIATHDRRDVVLATLQRIHALVTPRTSTEIIVVDNASADGAAGAIRRRFPDVQLLPLPRNRGSCAKALGARRARGEFVVFLDDDSYPLPGSIERMIARFARSPRLGAAGFRAYLPDGGEECSALPQVFIGCGVGLRRAALEAVGGLDADLFMQAEEYDLSFRLIAAGWDVRTFDDLGVQHLKSPQARLSERTVYYDTRNNLLLAARYLPDPYENVYRADWRQRYRWIAAGAGRLGAYWRGRLVASLHQRRQRRRYADRRLSPVAFERLFRLAYVSKRLAAVRRAGVRRVLLADLGKNVYPFVRSCRAHGLEPVAIADDRFARPNRRYRGIPILPVAAALSRPFDAIVVANTSPVHARRTETRLAEMTDAPIHRWFDFAMPDPAAEGPVPQPVRLPVGAS